MDKLIDYKKPMLGAIVIGVKSIEKAKVFYKNVFEIEIDHESENYLSAYLNGTHIELEENSKNRFPNWEKNHIGTYKNSEFIVPKIQVFLEKVNAFGGRVVSGPVQKPWGSTNAEIADPDGNMFSIVEKGK